MTTNHLSHCSLHIYSHIHLFLTFFLDCLTPEHGTNMLSQDDGNQLSTHIAYHPRKVKTSTTSRQKPEILHFWLAFRRCPVQAWLRYCLLFRVMFCMVLLSPSKCMSRLRLKTGINHFFLNPFDFIKCDNSLKSFDTKHFLQLTHYYITQKSYILHSNWQLIHSVVGFTSEKLKGDKASGTSKQMELVRRNWCQNQWDGTLYTSNKQDKRIFSGNKDK